MFCPNCGNQISDNVAFCGNCGKSINTNANSTESIKTDNVKTLKYNFFDINIFLNFKSFFSNFYIDYNSLVFKFAMAILMALGIGKNLYSILRNYFLSDIKIVNRFSDIFELGSCLLFFGVFLIVFIKKKQKLTVKKSNFLQVFWIVTIVLVGIGFFTYLNGLHQYIIYSGLAINIVELLLPISAALLLCVNKPKYPIALIISLIFFAASSTSLWNIRWDFLTYEIYKDAERLLPAIDSISSFILIGLLFLIRYIIPEKISKWAVYVPAVLLIIRKFIVLIEEISLFRILSFAYAIIEIAMFVLFTLSCSRKVKYDYTVTNGDKVKKSVIKVGIISLSTIVVIILSYTLTTAIISSNHINNIMLKWEEKITNGSLKYSQEWDEATKDFNKYGYFKTAEQFVDNYYIYSKIKTNIYTMERISNCYYSYQSGVSDSSLAENYSEIDIDESWENDSILSSYYKKYIEMKPDIENVYVSVRIDLSEKEVTVTVENDNLLPLSKCTVRSDFTICYVKAGYYSDNEYGRGSEIYTVEDIPGKSEKKVTFSFDPDDYYDSYGSYLVSFLFDSDYSLVSIE